MLAPQFDPVALQLGPLAIHWYGLMYVFGFLIVQFLSKRIMIEKGEWGSKVNAELYDGLLSWLIIGVLIGGRLAYVLFYNLPYYIEHPIEVLYIWQGGMSFHGGLLGPLVLGFWYCHKHKLPFLLLTDRICTVAPLALAFGRMGNFINGELWGRVSDVPWAMVFPGAGPLPRHPSQLYELALEGIVLFIIMWLMRHRNTAAGSQLGLFLLGYGVFRIFCEQFRQPDAQLGYYFGFLTMGSMLSSAMLLLGSYLLFRRRV